MQHSTHPTFNKFQALRGTSIQHTRCPVCSTPNLLLPMLPCQAPSPHRQSCLSTVTSSSPPTDRSPVSLSFFGLPMAPHGPRVPPCPPSLREHHAARASASRSDNTDCTSTGLSHVSPAENYPSVYSVDFSASRCLPSWHSGPG